MSRKDQQEQKKREAGNESGLYLAEPSMSAPSPMPGKPAASYVKQTAAAQPSQTDWQPPQLRYVPQAQGWTGNQPPVQGYPVQQGYQPPPVQGIPGGQPQPTGSWQQPSWNQPYQAPTGRGWTQPYPAQQPQRDWQGGYTVGQWPGNGYAPGFDAQPASQGGQEAQGNDSILPFGPATVVKLIAAAVVVIIAVVIGVRLFNAQRENQALQAAVAAYENRYLEGVYVDGIHLGGMTREEAQTAVQKSAQLKCDEWNVSLTTASGEYLGEINSYDLGMTVHVDDALDEAWRQGRINGSAAEQKAAMDVLLVNPYTGSTALPSGDTTAIDRILDELAQNFRVEATDAYIASFTALATNPFDIVEETVGRYLDVESIKAQVYDMVSRMESGTIILEPTPLYPSVTASDLRRYTTKIGSHYTAISTTSTAERDDNIKRACELINGKIIAPGEVFSFNDVVGARSKKNGFKLATVYNYGKEEPGYGGGVCQVSSTLYVAAVRANMDIVKRTQHGLKVNYTDFGLDATVNYDGKKIDFAFRNNTSGNIYIVTKVMRNPQIDRQHNLVICDIYGPALETGVTYDLVATTTEIPIPEATAVPDKKAEHVIYTDETYTEAGKIGYEVDSYRVKYVNGAEVERKHMYHDTYPATQPITYVGISERPDQQ